MLISNSNVSLVCTLHMKTVKNFSIIPKSEKTKMKKRLCLVAPKVHYALSDTSQSNQTSTLFFNIGNIIQKCKRDATQVHGKYTREHPKGGKEYYKKYI